LISLRLVTQSLIYEEQQMKVLAKAALVTLTLVSLAGCMHKSDAVGSDGRPHAPSNQPVPGASEGAGPVGQPQS
jgi:hypothetical protein